MPSVQYQVRLSLIVFAVGTLAGCQPSTSDGIMPEAARKLDPPEQNGARIYYTGASQRGGPISRTGGSAFGGSMMGLGVQDRGSPARRATDRRDAVAPTRCT